MFLYEVWHAEYENHINFCESLTVLMKKTIEAILLLLMQ